MDYKQIDFAKDIVKYFAHGKSALGYNPDADEILNALASENLGLIKNATGLKEKPAKKLLAQYAKAFYAGSNMKKGSPASRPAVWFLFYKLQVKLSTKSYDVCLSLIERSMLNFHVLLENPYRFIAVPNMTFDKIDAAVSTWPDGITKTLKRSRLNAFVAHELASKLINANGDYYEYNDLIKEIRDHFVGEWKFKIDLKDDTGSLDTARGAVFQTIYEYFDRIETSSGHFIFQPNEVGDQEDYVANRLEYYRTLQDKDVDDLWTKLQVQNSLMPFRLSQEQIRACWKMITKPIFVLQGFAGTGKSTIMRVVSNILREEYGDSVYLCAPTGKASENLKEATGFEAKTISYYTLPQIHDLETASAVIVDEMSMVGLKLFNKLLHKIPRKCQLIMIGDPAQLSPIKDISILHALIDSKKVETQMLTEVFRQGKNSGALLLGTKARYGQNPLNGNVKFSKAWYSLPNKNLHLFSTPIFDIDSKTEMQKMVRIAIAGMTHYAGDINKMKHVNTKPLKRDIYDWMIIAPTNKAVDYFNSAVQALVNPKKKHQPSLLIRNGRNDYEIRIDDMVINTMNQTVHDEYGAQRKIANGDKGVVIDITSDTVTVEMDTGIYEFSDGAYQHLMLGYAGTIHKAQGSTIKNVMLVLATNQDYFLLNRELVYTAVTRASENLYLLCNTEYYDKAVKTVQNVQDLELTEKLKKIK